MGNSGKAPDSRDDCEGPCSECQGPEDPKPLRDIEDLKPKQGTVAYWDPLRSQVIRIGRVRRMPQHRLAQVQAAEARQAPEVPQAAEAPQEAQEELENRGENNEAVKLWLETLPDSIPPPEDNVSCHSIPYCFPLTHALNPQCCLDSFGFWFELRC